jgi:hypothetical protein
MPKRPKTKLLHSLEKARIKFIEQSMIAYAAQKPTLKANAGQYSVHAAITSKQIEQKNPQ